MYQSRVPGLRNRVIATVRLGSLAGEAELGILPRDCGPGPGDSGSITTKSLTGGSMQDTGAGPAGKPARLCQPR